MGSTAYQIPLAYQSPQFISPMDARLKGMSLQELNQRIGLQQQQQQLEEEQTRGAQLENQQRDFQMRYQQALNSALMEGYGLDQQQPGAPGSPSQQQPSGAAPAPAAAPAPGGASGTTPPQAVGTGAAPPSSTMPVMDYNRVANRLIASGFGSMVPGLMAGHIDLMTKQAQVTKDMLANTGTAMEQASQLLQGAKDQQSYSAVLPRVRGYMQQFGVDPSTLPDVYDPQKVQSALSWGTKRADELRHGYEAADLAQRLSQGLPKTADDYEKSYYNDISQAKNQEDLDAKNAKWSTLVQQDPTGLGQKLLDRVRVQNWTGETPEIAAVSQMPPQDRVGYFQKHLELTSQRLAAAASQGQDAYAAEYARTNPSESPLFPKPADFDPETTQDQVRNAGMTASQAALSDFRGQRMSIYDQQMQLMRDRLNFMESKTGGGAGQGKPLTPGQVKVEERNIANLEYGTPTRQGLHDQRLQLGQTYATLLKQAQTGKDAQGNDLTQDYIDRVTKKYNAATLQDAADAVKQKLDASTNSLQNLMYRKADLYHVQAPNPQDVQAAREGEEITALDGSVWRKRDGVAYFSGMGGQQSQPQQSAPPAPPTAPTRQTAAAPAAQPRQNPAPAAPPKATPPVPPRTNAAPPSSAGVTVKLPNGRYATFPNQDSLNRWAKDQGLTLK